ncbi:hypothetical protein H4R21_004666 [Coemansia helicoidea]|uniref:Uncharacterized protein n=1 Tax=Coemansia helicoidea TaxID=1286919 RepID=A0ACC1KWS1_9FUNG|nr:hypothetical protein H4R21_004666 [Coemansia helicoidea]
MSMGSDEEEEEEGGAENGAADEEREAADSGSEQGERMTTRQDTNPGRRRTLQRLMAAIREGDFDSDVSDDGDDEPRGRAAPASRTRAARRSRRRSARSQRARPQPGHDSDSDYVQNAADNNNNSDDEGLRAEDDDAADDLEQLRQTEKKLILKFKTAGRARTAGAGSGGAGGSRTRGELRLDDIDWSEFDPETINQILARREALRKKRRRGKSAAGGAGDGEVTTAKLKKSSLAPPPLQISRARVAPGRVREEGEYEEDGDEDEDGAVAEEAVAGGFDTMDVDNTEHEFVGLFEDSHEAATQAPRSQLHLPPRALPVSTGDLAGPDAAYDGLYRSGRPHPALIRNMTDRHMNADKDMRIVLQYELQQEESLFKDLQAEILDKLLKLQAEERLLRLIVKKDFELPDDVNAEEAGAAAAVMDTAYAGLNEAELGMLHGALGTLQPMDVDEASGSESDSSLSGMSSGSGSSDDEVATRGALSRMLEGLEPNGGASSSSVSPS